MGPLPHGAEKMMEKTQKKVPGHPVEAPVKITRWRSLVMTFWNFNKIASLLFQHSNDFCKCNFYILKLSMWNLHRYGWDIEDGARKHFGPVVSPSRFANLRNNGAGHLTFSLSKNFSSSFCQTLIVFPKHFRTSNHKTCYNSKKLCSMTILEENLTKKCQNRIVELKLIFCVKIIFFRKIRHNRHFFRQTGRNFFIVEKCSFKLWSWFHTGATPEGKLCTWMWELWRNGRFSAFFSNFDPSYLNTYDELAENFLHACSP